MINKTALAAAFNSYRRIWPTKKENLCFVLVGKTAVCRYIIRGSLSPGSNGCGQSTKRHKNEVFKDERKSYHKQCPTPDCIRI